MKKLFILTLMAFTAMLCNAQDALFRKYDNTKGVTTVYVSKAMFSMMPKIKAGDINISKLAGKMDRSCRCSLRPLVIGRLHPSTRPQPTTTVAIRTSNEGERKRREHQLST